MKNYLLGKLIHYIADAFTFPHNNVFKRNLVQHCKYENKLHQAYLNGERICATDYQYILNATTLVFGYFSEEYAELWSECMAFLERLRL